MPRGQADFGMYAVKEVSASISDMGEVAARLGSISIFDRRGDVAYFDNFEDPPLKWQILPVVTTGIGILDDTSPRSGSLGLKLTSPAVIDDYVYARLSTQFRGSYRVGAEISFSNWDDDAYWDLIINVETGTRLVGAGIRYDPNAETLYYRDSVGDWQVLATDLILLSGAFRYYTWKLVIDADTEKYVRALFGVTEYNMEAYSVEATDSVEAPVVVPLLYIRPHIAVAQSVHLDDFIQTINEP